jgi:hypothetical protein
VGGERVKRVIWSSKEKVEFKVTVQLGEAVSNVNNTMNFEPSPRTEVAKGLPIESGVKSWNAICVGWFGGLMWWEWSRLCMALRNGLNEVFSFNPYLSSVVLVIASLLCVVWQELLCVSCWICWRSL